MSLQTKLKARAPLRLDSYIEACLWDETEGYYQRNDVFGAQGDFITSPEISQIFGEVIGLWIAQAWAEMGRPTPFTLIELGAGRGILMRDALRVAMRVDGFKDAVQIFIVEKSTKRRKEQNTNIDYPIVFLDDANFPEIPAIIFSNEFFDALPIRQFRNEGGGWLEAFVDHNLEKTWLACPAPPQSLSRFMNRDGIIELNEPAIAFASHLGKHLRRVGGRMLTIDYGDWDGIGDTLQAVRQHQIAHVFTRPGEADLTAHIRFRDLAEAALLDADFMTQTEFLESFGGTLRLEALIRANPALADELAKGYARLTASNKMGKLFKVLIQKA